MFRLSLSGILERVLSGCIRFYQLGISPLLGRGKCRFFPSCSEYARQAIQLHGPLKGLWLALKRIVRCGPWSPGGYDPVPKPGEGTTTVKER
ncbi:MULTISPECIES: membrane protein insertion efficiency factor YidD [Jonquetella]|uniref:membrane protein insertion efficiency factor YidD n=1 Tax=Jonquetella TaxID=428711 RepID=UPI0002E36672|nr:MULTISPECIES: membrane protein insertion efficiency factor YidD [Jonquetella]